MKQACIEVQGVVNGSLEKITSRDPVFVVGISTAMGQSCSTCHRLYGQTA